MRHYRCLTCDRGFSAEPDRVSFMPHNAFCVFCGGRATALPQQPRDPDVLSRANVKRSETMRTRHTQAAQ